MGDSFIQLRACTGGLGPQGARQREEEEDVTNTGSDCVTTLIKMERATEGMQKGNGETTVCRECQYRGQTLWDYGGEIYIKRQPVPPG